VRDVYGKLLDQGMNYLRLSQELFGSFQSLQSAAQLGESWTKVLNSMFEQAKQACTQASADGSDVVRGCLALWGLPLDNWRRVASSLSLLPGDMLHGFKEQDVRHLGDALRANLQRFLSIPALGYTREWQEQGQEAMAAWLQYEQAMNRYVGVMSKMVWRALDLLQHKVLEMTSAGTPVENLRQIYDLWVDCSEEAYAEVAGAAEYGEVSAELINASMQLKRHGQLLTEEVMGALNMPTRQELDTAHLRTHQLKGEVKALEQRLKEVLAQEPAGGGTLGPKARADGDLAMLRQEMQTLQQELEALKEQLAATPSPAPAGRTAARTSAAARKNPRPKGQGEGG
jgi:class III poly(R)-hydroxyalkanoic acid synthase PhaE subunit